MKILWFINVPLPEANLIMGEKALPFGGWLIEASKALSSMENIQLFVAFPSKKVKKMERLKGDCIVYYAFKPINRRSIASTENIDLFKNIILDINPDIVNIFGTELPHSLTALQACEMLKIRNVVTIQGLVSIIAKHMYANLPIKTIIGTTIRNLLARDNVYWMKKSFQRRGWDEIKAIKRTSHVIGRTTWDKACTIQINPNLKYHFCNETLRERFYRYEWNLSTCEKYSIFISQGHYSIKGVHSIIEALPTILNKYPETKVYIGGKDITDSLSLIEKLKMTHYGKYIKRIISKKGLGNHIVFTGTLNEEEILQRYLKSHVYVCPSSIENSPNSLGEAMLLGVPCIASYVGGIPDLIKDKEEGFLYQHDAPYMLAHYVCQLFEKNELAKMISTNARKHALKTHDIHINTERLLSIYNEIVHNKDEYNASN